MGAAKIAISLERSLLKRLDELVEKKKFKTRSDGIQQAVRAQIRRLDCARLAQECANLNPSFERQLADEGLSEDAKAWPEF